MAMLLRRHRAKRDKRQTTSAHTAPATTTLTPAEVDALKGKALDAALEAAGLPKTGKADAKRAALTAHYAAPQGDPDDDTEGTPDGSDEAPTGDPVADSDAGDGDPEPGGEAGPESEPADEPDES